MIYRQYTAGAAATTTTSTMDIRVDDTINAVVLDLTAVGVADGDTFYAELSWQQTPSQTTNDISNVLASVQLNIELTTSGAAALGRTITIPVDQKAFQGERLYLHCVNTGTGTSKAWAFVCTSKEPPKGGNRGR